MSTVATTSRNTLSHSTLSLNTKQIPVLIQRYILKVELNIPMTRLSTLLSTFHLFSEVFFVENKITTAGPNPHKEHGPEIITRKIIDFFLNLWTHKPQTKKDSPVWYLRLADKTKEGSFHGFNKNKTKKYHYGPLTIITIRGTSSPSNSGDRHIDNTPE